MQNQYGTGKTTYFGGLPNAQSGTLNPSGYVEREQRRSGLAAVALARQKAMKSATPVGPNLSATKKMLNSQGLYLSPTGKIGRL